MRFLTNNKESNIIGFLIAFKLIFVVNIVICCCKKKFLSITVFVVKYLRLTCA